MHLWVVYLLAAALGFVNVFDNPARQSFISEMVPEADLPNAVLLNSVSMNMARVFGAAVGGTVAAVLGLTLCFALNAVSFGAVLLSLALMSAAALYPAKKVAKKKGQVVAGLRYVRTRREILVPLIMIAVVGTLAWEFQVTLPLMATSVFHGWIFRNGAAAYGVMASVMGAGAVVGGHGLSGQVACNWGAGIVWAALVVPGGDRVGHRDHGGGARPEHAGRAHRHGLRRVRLNHVQFARQDQPATRGQAGDARAGDGPVGAGMAWLDAHRRADRRLDRPGGGPALGADRRRRGHARLRPARS